MATAVKRVDESVNIVGSTSKAVMERVAIAVRGLRGYSVARSSPDVAHIAFVNKKLLGSTTHMCAVTVSSGPRGLHVSIQGEFETSRLDQLRAAVLGTSMEDLRDRDRADQFGIAVPVPHSPPPPMSVPTILPADAWRAAAAPVAMTPPMPSAPAHSASPVNVAQSSLLPTIRSLGASPQPILPVIPPQPGWSRPGPATQSAIEDNRTIMRPYLSGPHRAAAPVDGPRSIAVALGDGRQFELVHRIVLGRDPAVQAEDLGAIPVRVDDDGVSKTHLVIGRSGDDAWIEDRRSTNGTTIVDAAGRSVVVSPAQRTTVSIPATVLIGDQRLSIIWQ